MSVGDKSNATASAGRDVSIGGRTSSVESWDYHDPYMARRWAKHLHGYRLRVHPTCPTKICMLCMSIRISNHLEDDFSHPGPMLSPVT